MLEIWGHWRNSWSLKIAKKVKISHWINLVPNMWSRNEVYNLVAQTCGLRYQEDGLKFVLSFQGRINE